MPNSLANSQCHTVAFQGTLLEIGNQCGQPVIYDGDDHTQWSIHPLRDGINKRWLMRFDEGSQGLVATSLELHETFQQQSHLSHLGVVIDI
jgi:hypothetical protein